MTGFAVNPDAAARLLRNSVDSRKSESCSFVCRLCRIEGLKDSALNFRAHSSPRIAHGQHHVSSRLDGAVRLRELTIKNHVSCLDSKLAAAGHRITRVDRQV